MRGGLNPNANIDYATDPRFVSARLLFAKQRAAQAARDAEAEAQRTGRPMYLEEWVKLPWPK